MTENKNYIELDNLRTYPNELLSILKKYDDRVSDFSFVKTNEYWYDNDLFCDFLIGSLHNSLLNAIQENEYKFKFYHITKLLDYEIENILTEGFLKTNPESVKKKIKDAYLNGLIPGEIYRIPTSNIACESQNPYSRIFFYYTKSGIVEDNVNNKMDINTYWGGESITWNVHEFDEVLRVLNEIGELCVVSFYINDLIEEIDTIVDIIIIAYVSLYHDVVFPYKHLVSSNSKESPIIIEVDSFEKFSNNE